MKRNTKTRIESITDEALLKEYDSINNQGGARYEYVIEHIKEIIRRYREHVTINK